MAGVLEWGVSPGETQPEMLPLFSSITKIPASAGACRLKFMRSGRTY